MPRTNTESGKVLYLTIEEKRLVLLALDKLDNLRAFETLRRKLSQ